MGTVYAKMELINAADIALAKMNSLEEVKKISIDMLLNSGAYMLAINERIQEQLYLPTIEFRKVQMADGLVVEYKVVGPIIIKFENRTASANAFVLPGDSKPILGIIPMQELDVLIDDQKEKLIINPNHPDGAQLRI